MTEREGRREGDERMTYKSVNDRPCKMVSMYMGRIRVDRYTVTGLWGKKGREVAIASRVPSNNVEKKKERKIRQKERPKKKRGTKRKSRTNTTKAA